MLWHVGKPSASTLTEIKKLYTHVEIRHVNVFFPSTLARFFSIPQCLRYVRNLRLILACFSSFFYTGMCCFFVLKCST